MDYFNHLRRLTKVKPFLSRKSFETVIHAFISSWLDYCNSLYYGLPVSSINQLQLVQNAAARLLTGSHKWVHITPILRSPHWLPLQYCHESKPWTSGHSPLEVTLTSLDSHTVTDHPSRLHLPSFTAPSQLFHIISLHLFTIIQSPSHYINPEHSATLGRVLLASYLTKRMSRIQAMNFWSLSTRGHSHITGLSHSYRSPF